MAANAVLPVDDSGVIFEEIRPPTRREDGPLLFAVDHCFPIKGQVLFSGFWAPH